MLDSPLISVVITAFRSGSLIREAIDSVMAQTFRDFEIIIVDNNASDDTKHAIADAVGVYPGWIRVIHEFVQGVPSARNKGVREAKGTYIALLDDDDKMYPQRLEKQLLSIRQSPECALVYGAMDLVSFDGKEVVTPFKVDSPGNWSQILFGDSPRFTHDPLVEARPSVIFFEKSKAISLGLFDERFNPFWLEETEFYLRMWERGSFIFVPEPLIAFRLPSPEFLRRKRTGNTSWLMARRNQNLFFSILVNKYFDPDRPDSRKRFRKIRSQWLREMAMDVLKYKDGSSIGRKLMLRALSDSPREWRNWKWFFRTWLPRKSLLRVLKGPSDEDGLLSLEKEKINCDEFFVLP